MDEKLNSKGSNRIAAASNTVAMGQLSSQTKNSANYLVTPGAHQAANSSIVDAEAEQRYDTRDLKTRQVHCHAKLTHNAGFC